MDQFSRHPLYQKHDIDSVMSSLWAFYKAKFMVLFITSFVISLGIQYLSLTFNFNELMNISNPLDLTEVMGKMRGLIWPIIAMSLVSLLSTTILHYYVIFNPIDNNISIFVAAYKSLKYYIPYLIIMILLLFAGSLAMILGLFVFIIGVFFAMLYVVTISLFVLPILMVEGLNIGNVISRTFTLVHKRFGPNIGWVAVFILIVMVISLVLSALIMIPFTGSFLKILSNPADTSNIVDYMTNPLYIMLTALVNALFTPLIPIFASILYFNGKAREEDVPASAYINEPDKVRVEDLYAKPYSDDHPDNPDKSV
jgi:hypothetical protein